VAVSTPEAAAALKHLRHLTQYKEAAALYRPTRLHIAPALRAAVAKALRVYWLSPVTQSTLRMITCKPRFGKYPYGFIERPGAGVEPVLEDVDLSHLLLLPEQELAAASPAEVWAALPPLVQLRALGGGAGWEEDGEEKPRPGTPIPAVPDDK
jgi:hypothetical protein